LLAFHSQQQQPKVGDGSALFPLVDPRHPHPLRREERREKWRGRERRCGGHAEVGKSLLDDKLKIKDIAISLFFFTLFFLNFFFFLKLLL
jgi:hypothetical protein